MVIIWVKLKCTSILNIPKVMQLSSNASLHSYQTVQQSYRARTYRKLIEFEQPEDYDKGCEQQTIVAIVCTDSSCAKHRKSSTDQKPTAYRETNTILSRYAEECRFSEFDLRCHLFERFESNKGLQMVDLAFIKRSNFTIWQWSRGSLDRRGVV